MTGVNVNIDPLSPTEVRHIIPDKYVPPHKREDSELSETNGSQVDHSQANGRDRARVRSNASHSQAQSRAQRQKGKRYNINEYLIHHKTSDSSGSGRNSPEPGRFDGGVRPGSPNIIEFGRTRAASPGINRYQSPDINRAQSPG
eukprot:44030_1